MKKTEIKQRLRHIGLSKNVAAVYVALLELGLTKAAPVISSVKMHRMLVYNALDELIERGLVTVVRKNNVKQFQATDPRLFVEQIKKLGNTAEDLLPDLKELQGEKSGVVDVRTLTGEDGFRTNLEEIIESASRQTKKEIHIIGGAKDTDFYDLAGDWYPTYIKLLEKNKISKRLLAPASYSSEFKKKFASEKNTELRTLSEGLNSPSYTRITKEMVSIEMYAPQVVIIQIRNKTIAQGYLDSFELLWGVSKK